jgi:hypothetical protein
VAEVLAYVDALEVSHDLSCGGAVPDALLGRFMPPVALDETAAIDDAGSYLNNVRFEPREVTVKIVVSGAGEDAARAALRALLGSIDPTLGIGRLLNTAGDGVVRELRCVYRGGFEGDETYVTQRGPSGAGPFAEDAYQIGLLIFRALDPFWYDADDTVVTFTRDNLAP